MGSCARPIRGQADILVAPINACDRIVPEKVTFTVSVAALAGATSVDVAITPATTRDIYVDPDVGLYIGLESSTGQCDFVRVTAPIPAGATATLTVDPLKRDLDTTATGNYPVPLGLRNSAELSSDDQNAETNTFDSDGWGAMIPTLLKQTLSTGGYYAPTDAGWLNVKAVRQSLGFIWAEVAFPPPECNDLYTTGVVASGSWIITEFPINAASPTDAMESSITFNSDGKITIADAA